MGGLKLAFSDVEVEVVPERGAIVAGLTVAGRDVLYLDRATLDGTGNVRGGIPVLFPFAGKLVDETFALTGTKMKQHGFGRNKPWKVTARDASSVRMQLDADAETRAQYPYEFVAEERVAIVPNGLQIELQIRAGDQPLPVSPGWHPYFNCADKTAVRGDLDTSKLGNDLEFDFGRVAPVDGRASFTLPEPVSLAFSPEMRHLQFWSQPGKPFICLEPFHGPAGTVNTGRRAWVPAGEARTWWLRVTVAPT